MPVSPRSFEEGTNVEEQKAALQLLLDAILKGKFDEIVPSTDSGWAAALKHSSVQIRMTVALWMGISGGKGQLKLLGDAIRDEPDQGLLNAYLTAIERIQMRRKSRFVGEEFDRLVEILEKCMKELPMPLDAIAGYSLAIGLPERQAYVIEELLDRLKKKKEMLPGQKNIYVRVIADICGDSERLAVALLDEDVYVRCYAAMRMLRLGNTDPELPRLLDFEYKQSVEAGDHTLEQRLRSYRYDAALKSTGLDEPRFSAGEDDALSH